MHWRVGMLALLDPSRQDIPEYAEYLGAIQREARRVNDRFAQMGWTPIDLRIEDDFAASVAAYKQYDVLLVNAIFDGLNLVAKEAPLVNTRDGVLILSENAGAHDELGDFALTINPFDVAGQAEAIHRALAMDESERRRRIEGIRARVREHDLGDVARGGAARARGHRSGAQRLTPRVSRERALARRSRRARSGWSTSAASRRRDAARSRRRGADGAGDGAAPARAAEGRRADDRAARGDHGREADERADPALPSAAALAHRGLARGRGRPRRDPRDGGDDRADGVEMEALTAASVAALTVYDMAKAVDKELTVESRSGCWRRRRREGRPS